MKPQPGKPELLAPAGQPDAGYAALHYGADAVYLGLNRFSARAEAVNFTPPELAEFAAYAHSLSPRRNVYLTLNTLVKQSELADAAETLLVASECDVDAVIIQDLGVAKLAREQFPHLRLHASTQMALHNADGARTARTLGFSRATVARELTLAELERLTRDADMEIEAFIHGTLCYAYSGLCLFSSVTTGRSGNRGRCVYSCREAAETPRGRLHPFSLKDLALGERVLDLARIGVASLKIEGRKKSPLYVAATVDYYRRILDGRLHPEEREACEARLQTIFARPWTRLFLDNRRNPDAADTGVVGHRGSRIGAVRRIATTPAGPAVVFDTHQPVERHDGLQIDIPGEARPFGFGFGIDNLYLMDKGKPKAVFEAPAGSELAAALPLDAPPLTPGLPVYLSSSQAVKRSFPFHRPKPGAFTPELSMNVAARLTAADGDTPSCRLECRAEAALPEYLRQDSPAASVAFELHETLSAFPARDAAGAEQAARTAFERTGGSGFRLANWRFDNPDGLFIRPGDWNRIRRDLLQGLEAARRERRESVRRKKTTFAADTQSMPMRPHETTVWGLAVDSPGTLAEFSEADLQAASEVIVGIADVNRAKGELAALAERMDKDRIRLAVPLILRGDDGERAAALVRDLTADGWRRWFVSGLAALPLFGTADGLDLAADWPLYVVNRLAATQLLELGFASFTLSPEDEAANMRRILAKFSSRAWVTAYSDLPLFISAACVHSHLGMCRGAKDGGCAESGQGLKIAMEKGGQLQVLSQQCGSVVTGPVPFCLAGEAMDELFEMGARRLRVDLRWRLRRPGDAVAIWRNARAGMPLAGTEANFRRGLQ